MQELQETFDGKASGYMVAIGQGKSLGPRNWTEHINLIPKGELQYCWTAVVGLFLIQPGVTFSAC